MAIESIHVHMHFRMLIAFFHNIKTWCA